VKKIVFVTDDSHFWKFVEDSFESINDDVVSMPPDATDEDIAASGADLLVMNFDRLSPLSSPLRRLKTIIIINGSAKPPEQTRSSRERVTYLAWPFTQSRILADAAAMLNISPRKKFRAIVRIFSSDSEAGTLGRSIDFSTTGMSFTSEEYFTVGKRLTVALSVPGGGDRLELPGRVVRDWTNEADGTREYGVEFMSLDNSVAAALSQFVLS
jgi:hypothetical protein